MIIAEYTISAPAQISSISGGVFFFSVFGRTKERCLDRVRFASISRNNSAHLLRRVRAITGPEQMQQKVVLSRSPRRRGRAHSAAIPSQAHRRSSC